MAGKMILETVRSEGLAHLSYFIAHDGQAAVVDPRRDCDVYLDLARRHGAAIARIFETHRNEDYVTGSCELARRTGATVHHGTALDWGYGEDVSDGDAFGIGDLRLEVIETPGHTYESISLALIDTSFSDDAVAVFTGDALFIGDVGRTDFFPDRAEEVAGLLHDSIFQKLLPLGDGVILCPAHGAGSVCGSGMASREFSTLGYERAHNPSLQDAGRDAFIQRKVDEHHYKPPYFKKMEQHNQNGDAPEMPNLPDPPPLSPPALSEAIDSGAQVVDVRSPEAFAGAFVPSSLSLPTAMISSYGGWLLSYDKPIVLVVESSDSVDPALRQLIRLGYDNIAGYFEDVVKWEGTGKPYGRIPAVHAETVKQRLESGEKFTLLDVRKIDEWESGHVDGATHIYLGELPDRLDEIQRDRPVTTMCGSGARAMIAASILHRAGFEIVEDNLGSMAACKAVGCAITK